MHNNENFKTFYEKAYLLFPIFNGRVSELESRHAELCELVKTAGAEVVGKMAVLAEGDAAKREDITVLAPLPLFTADGTPIDA